MPSRIASSVKLLRTNWMPNLSSNYERVINHLAPMMGLLPYQRFRSWMGTMQWVLPRSVMQDPSQTFVWQTAFQGRWRLISSHHCSKSIQVSWMFKERRQECLICGKVQILHQSVGLYLVYLSLTSFHLIGQSLRSHLLGMLIRTNGTLCSHHAISSPFDWIQPEWVG